MSAKLILVCFMSLLFYCANSYAVGGPTSGLDGLRFGCFRRKKTEDANPCVSAITVMVAQSDFARPYREPRPWTENEYRIFCMGVASGVFTSGVLFTCAVLKHGLPKFKLE